MSENCEDKESPAPVDGAGALSSPNNPNPNPNIALTERTVANIKRLQENVAPSSSSSSQNPSSSSSSASTMVWVGNYQVPPNADNVQQISVKSPLSIVQEEKDLTSPTAATSAYPQPAPVSPRPSLQLVTSVSSTTVDPNWQSSKKCVRERNAVMCNNPLMADVFFDVGGDLGDSERYPGHKYVLATGSSVFYAMFFGGLCGDSNKAKDEEEQLVISVPDVEPAAFLAMLRYLYYDQVSLDEDNVLATLYAAKKYIVPHLAGECVKFLEARLTAKNACVLLSQARLFEEAELSTRCWEVIDAQAELALLASDSFADVDVDTFKLILSRESLNCKETVVFRAALQWAEAECKRREIEEESLEKKREVLEPFLALIRFPAMDVEDFADEVVKSDVLSLQETTDIFLHFTATRKPVLRYPTEPRSGLQRRICQRFQSSAYRSNQWRYRGRCDSIQFCVDRRVFIVGFGLYGSSNGACDYSAKIELKCSSSSSSAESSSKSGSKSLTENTCHFSSDGSSKTFHVFFEQPVQVEPDHCYTASVTLDGSELSYFGQEGLTEVTVANVTFQFQSSAESTNGTGVQGGQIPELLFYGPSSNLSSSLVTIK